MAEQALDEQDIEEALRGLPGWRRAGDAIAARYKGERSAVPALYQEVAAAEDEANHHATVEITYNSVGFTLSTHDAGGKVTRRDVDQAGRISALCAKHGFTVA